MKHGYLCGHECGTTLPVHKAFSVTPKEGFKMLALN